jgi:hypothetical protein
MMSVPVWDPNSNVDEETLAQRKYEWTQKLVENQKNHLSRFSTFIVNVSFVMVSKMLPHSGADPCPDLGPCRLGGGRGVLAFNRPMSAH